MNINNFNIKFYYYIIIYINKFIKKNSKIYIKQILLNKNN